jgi:hypothetical protein
LGLLKNKNRELITEKLGRKGDRAQYLHEIYFTPSFAPKTVPELKRLFMADACHVNFGNYFVLLLWNNSEW